MELFPDIVDAVSRVLFIGCNVPTDDTLFDVVEFTMDDEFNSKGDNECFCANFNEGGRLSL